MYLEEPNLKLVYTYIYIILVHDSQTPLKRRSFCAGWVYVMRLGMYYIGLVAGL